MTKVLTGLQPTGIITLGNYVGAIKQMVEMQNDYEMNLFIADLHSITVQQDPKDLHEKIRSLIALYIACGIDLDKNLIYLQSDNPYHTAVSWLLECSTPYGELTRMTQFKDKSLKNISFSAGLLTYPVLMAADILIYDVDFVPVGVDQKQHVELARNIAERFNKKYGDTFKIPDVKMSESGAKIMDLVDPTKKMSKSSENPKSVIRLLDTKEEITKKIMSATTDSDCVIKYDEENKPGISNLMNIVISLTDETKETIEKKFSGKNYGEFKRYVANIVCEKIGVIQERYYKIIEDPKLDEVLNKNAEIVREIALRKYNEMKEKMGLYK